MTANLSRQQLIICWAIALGQTPFSVINFIVWRDGDALAELVTKDGHGVVLWLLGVIEGFGGDRHGVSYTSRVDQVRILGLPLAVTLDN